MFPYSKYLFPPFLSPALPFPFLLYSLVGVSSCEASPVILADNIGYVLLEEKPR